MGRWRLRREKGGKESGRNQNCKVSGLKKIGTLPATTQREKLGSYVEKKKKGERKKDSLVGWRPRCNCREVLNYFLSKERRGSRGRGYGGVACRRLAGTRLRLGRAEVECSSDAGVCRKGKEKVKKKKKLAESRRRRARGEKVRLRAVLNGKNGPISPP